MTAEDTGIQITRAACLGSPDGFRGELAMQGFDLLKVRPTPSKGSANGPLDIDAYAGIRFHAMALNRFPALGEVGPDILVMFPNSETSRSGQCELSAVDCNDFRKTVTLSPTWTEYRVYFDELRQAEGGSGQPFAGDLFSIIFAVEGREQDRLSQPFDFCVSQIYFLEEKSE